MKKFLIDFIKSNPFLFSCIILTTLIPLYYSLGIVINFFPPYKNEWQQFWDFSGIIILVQIIGYFLHKKFVWFSRILTFWANTFLIFIFMLGMTVRMTDSYARNESYMYGKPEYYQEVLNLFPEKYIVHFPKQIPSEATDVKMNTYRNYFFGSEVFALKFAADEKYIRNELQKYNFIKKTKLDEGEWYDTYAYYSVGKSDWGLEEFDFYVIQGRGYRRDNNMGIAVNPDFSEIVYYYSAPD